MRDHTADSSYMARICPCEMLASVIAHLDSELGAKLLHVACKLYWLSCTAREI